MLTLFPNKRGFIMAKAKNIQQITLTAVCVAVLAACGGGGGSSGSPNTSSTDTNAYAEEAAAANKVTRCAFRIKKSKLITYHNDIIQFSPKNQNNE